MAKSGPGVLGNLVLDWISIRKHMLNSGVGVHLTWTDWSITHWSRWWCLHRCTGVAQWNLGDMAALSSFSVLVEISLLSNLLPFASLFVRSSWNFVFPSSKIWRLVCHFWPTLILSRKKIGYCVKHADFHTDSTQINVQAGRALTLVSLTRAGAPGPMGDVHSH